MKKSWIKLICDPIDGSALKLTNPHIKKGRIISGKLISKSGNLYLIKQGIPQLLPPGAQSLDSVSSFAFEWDKWGYLFAKNNWLKNNILPLLGTTNKFKDKVIVDAGAGSGAPSRWMAESGAKLVISLELSNTIFKRHQETIKGFEEVIFPIQCDIAHPPIKIKPDILYCVNVIQHTQNPLETFKKLTSLLSNNSIFIFNVYHQEGFLGSKLVIILRSIIRWLPYEVWRWFSLLIALPIFSLNKISPNLIKSTGMDIHFAPELNELWQQIYDAFGAHHYQFTFSRKEQLQLFRENGLLVKKDNYLGYLLVKKANNKNG